MSKRKRSPRRRSGEIGQVAELPASCPHCRSTQLKAVRIVADRTLVGRIAGGQRYNRVVWRDKTCEGCGARVRVRSYHHTGEPSDSEPSTSTQPDAEADEVPAEPAEE